MKKRYYLKNKKRFYAILVVLTFIMFSSYLMASANDGGTSKTYNVISVNSGDTLWNIAKEYNPNGDIRKFIYEIKEINNLSGSEIYAGDELKIPARF